MNDILVCVCFKYYFITIIVLNNILAFTSILSVFILILIYI